MKVKILSGAIAGGRPLNPGDIYDGPKGECEILVSTGRAVEINAPPVELDEPEHTEIGHDEDRESVKTEYKSPSGKKVGVRKRRKTAKKKGSE